MIQITRVQIFLKLIAIVITLNLLSSCNPNNTSNQSTTAQNQPQQSSQAGTTQTQELKTVRVALSWLLQGVDAPLITAIDQGYFKEAGLNITWERGFGNGDTINKLGAGQYDMGFSDIYNMIEFNAKNPGQKLVAVAVPFNRGPFAIVSLKKSGIDTPQKLAGKKLGSPAGDGPRRLWPLFAKQVGIEPDSVTWTTMDPKLRETFLVQGQVDAVSGYVYSIVPNVIKAGIKPEEINIFYYNDNGLDLYGNAVLARAEFVEQNPEAVKAFVDAYIKGLKDTIAQPDAALANVKQAGDQLIDMQAEKLRLDIGLEQLIITDEAKANGLGAVEPQRLQTTIDQTVAGFNLTSKPKIEEVFDNRFLPPKSERTF